MVNSQKLAVFVPSNATVWIASLVVRGSALVGNAESPEAKQITVDYEGNLHGAANIQTFADRARHAASRKTRLSPPTRARCTVPRCELRQVGWFDPENGITLLDDAQAQEALAFWLGVEDLDPKELRFSACSL